MRGVITEAELAAKAVAPRVTLEQLEATIASEHYFTATQGVLGAAIDEALEEVPEALDLLTFCVLRLYNGFTAHGVSACAAPENYNREIGERLARADAVNKIWPLLGYELKTKLYTPIQGAYRPEGQAEPQASAASPARAEEATGDPIQTIAKTCHEANRAYCASLGDFSQLAWEDAPGWQQQSAIAGVEFIIANPDSTPAASHESWLEVKEAEGWTWGPEKDPVNKLHPCCVPYDQLPADQKAKDYIFGAIVRSLKGEAHV